MTRIKCSFLFSDHIYFQYDQSGGGEAEYPTFHPTPKAIMNPCLVYPSPGSPALQSPLPWLRGFWEPTAKAIWQRRIMNTKQFICYSVNYPFWIIPEL